MKHVDMRIKTKLIDMMREQRGINQVTYSTQMNTFSLIVTDQTNRAGTHLNCQFICNNNKTDKVTAMEMIFVDRQLLGR